MRLQLEEKTKISQQLRQRVAVTSILVGLGFLGIGAFSLLSQSQELGQSGAKLTQSDRPIRQPLNPGDTPSSVTREVLVKYRPARINLTQNTGTTRNRIKALETEYHIQPVDRLVEANIVQYEVAGSGSVDQTITALQRDPEVESVQPNYQYTSLTNDPRFSEQWALQNTGQTINGSTGTSGKDIAAPAAWAAAPGLPNVVVAVIDTGVEYRHPDLVNVMWDGSACVDDLNQALGGCVHGYDFEDNDLDPLPTTYSHGTLVSNIIAAQSNNSVGIAGVAPNAKIMALKVNLTTLEIIRAIRFAQNNGAKVINASWGGSAYDLLLYDAIAQYSGLFVAAAGNYGAEHGTYGFAIYPCDYTLANIVCVTASDNKDGLPYWADVGATSVDLAAPGATILSGSTKESLYEEYFNTVAAPALPAGWTTDGTFGTRESPYSMNSLYGDATHAPYVPNANTTATSPVINLSGATGAKVEFLTGCDTEYTSDWSDYMSIEMKNVPVFQAPTFDRTWGSIGTGNSQFQFPSDVGTDAAGNVYVTDKNNNMIKKFDAVGNFILSWGGGGSATGKFSGPTELAIDRSGNVFVNDSGNNRIQKFNATGGFLTAWDTYGQVNGFTVDAAGYVYEVDFPHLKVNTYDTNGAMIQDWTPSSQVSGAKYIAVDTSGNVYLTFQATGLIKAFTNDGTFITQWGSIGSGTGQFQTISGISVDGQKNIYVADSTLNRIQVFTSTGTYLGAWGTSGSGNGQFSGPSGPAFGLNGALVIVDTNNHRVQTFTPTASTINADWTEMARWNEKSIDDNAVTTDATLGYQGIPIPASAMTSSFQFRFHWVSDSADSGTTGDGCWIDYLGLSSLGDGTLNQYEFADGTSFAAPHVVGVAALVLGSRPTLTTAQLKQVIVDSGDLAPEFSGLTVSGKRVNAYRALMFPQTAQVSNVPASYTQLKYASVTVSGFDVVNYRYALDGAAWSADTAVAQPIVLSGVSEGAHTLLVVGQDSTNVRQWTDYPTKVEWTVDSTPPTGTITYSAYNTAYGYVTATLTTSEPVTVTSNYGYKTKTFYQNGSFTFTFTDRAGLTGSAVANVTTIDRTPPIGTISYSSTATTNLPVVATLTANEPITVTNNSGSPSYTFFANGIFFFYFTDAAGNYGSATAVVNNITTIPIGSVSISPSGTTAGPVTLTLRTDVPTPTNNNNGQPKIRLYNNGTFLFDVWHKPNAVSFSSTVSSIVTPNITSFLKVTKGVFKEKNVSIRPFQKYSDTVIGLRVGFGALGTVNMFLPYKPFAQGNLAVFDGNGQRLQTMNLPNKIASKGLSTAISKDLASNRVHLAVVPNKDSRTVALYEVSPTGLRTLPAIMASQTVNGPVTAMFKNLFGNQQRLVTYVNNDVKTVQVWWYNVPQGTYVKDTTYTSKHFSISKGKFAYLSGAYKPPKYTSKGGPSIALSLPQVQSSAVSFTTTLPGQKTDVFYDWGPTPEFGNTWSYYNTSSPSQLMNIPSPVGSVTSYRVRACNAGTTTCTITPTYTFVGR